LTVTNASGSNYDNKEAVFAWICAGHRIVSIGDHSLLLSGFASPVTCFENACAHMGLPFDGRIVENGVVTCPHRGFQYALDSGECLTTPQVQLQSHDVRVVGDRIEVRLTS
jgi:nitrite reductase/ring-hydroxylating ferredoxin subunit